jgi:hypothetical protein
MSRKDQILVLSDENLGHQPFPVRSDPIFFSSRPSKATKQEQIQRSYALTATNRNNPAIFHIIEQTSFDLDKASHQFNVVRTAKIKLHQKIWDSGIGLSSWFARLHSGIVANTALVSHVKNILFASKCDVLELGDNVQRVALLSVQH